LEKNSFFDFVGLVAAALLFCTAASADVCPDGVRTVDFGLSSDDGQVLHGGVRVRVHDGVKSLLGPDGMDCYPLLSGESNPTDEDGSPMPLGNDVDLDGGEVSDLISRLVVTRAFSQEDAELMGDGQVFVDSMLGSDIAVRTETETFLCLVEPGLEGAVVCLIKPLSTETVSTVALCGAGECAMPTAIGDSLVVTAIWQDGSTGMLPTARVDWVSDIAIHAIAYVESNLSNRSAETSQ
jgi:hypothetical protein